MSGRSGRGRFRALDHREVYRGRRISVAVGTFEAPDGSTFERDVVRHPGAVAVLPLHEDGTVTIVRQYRAALDLEIWEIPAGLRDVEGEDPETTAARELAEEVGLSAENLDHLATFHNSPGFCDEQVVVYLATGLSECSQDRQGIEEQAMDTARIPLEELLRMVFEGRVTDAKTVIGALALARRAG